MVLRNLKFRHYLDSQLSGWVSLEGYMKTAFTIDESSNIKTHLII